MKCPNCGQELADNVRFCVNCGFKLTPPAQTEQPKAQEVSPNKPETPKPQAPELTLQSEKPAQPAQSAQPAASVAGVAAAGVAAASAANTSSVQPAQPTQNPYQPVSPAQPRPAAQTVSAGQPMAASAAPQAAPSAQPTGYSTPAGQTQAQYARPAAAAQPPVQPAYTPVAAAPVQTSSYDDDPTTKPYGVGGFMLVTFLETLPIIGFILQLVWAFGSGNVNRRNYARAKLIWLLIGIILAIVIGVLGTTVFGGVFERIAKIVGTYGPDALLNGLK